MVRSIIQHFLRWCPGAIGIVLRQKMYPSFLGACGKNVIFGRYVDLHNPKSICIADNVVLSNRCSLQAGPSNEKERGIRIEEHVFVGIGTEVNSEKGGVLIQKGANLGSGCRLIATTSMIIGENVLVAAFCTIGNNSSKSGKAQAMSTVIGDDVWLGARCHVNSSVRIGSGSIIGAHAVVHDSIDNYGIAIGNPAVVLRYRK